MAMLIMGIVCEGESYACVNIVVKEKITNVIACL